MDFRWKPDLPILWRSRVKNLTSLDIYVDGRKVGTLGCGKGTSVIVPPGIHEVFLKVNHVTSDIIELDLQLGEHAEFEGRMKPLIQNRFFRFFELKFYYLATPLAIIAYVSKPVMHFIEENLKYEFLAIAFLSMFGFLASFPRLFSRKPGAMLSLTRAATVDVSEPLDPFH